VAGNWKLEIRNWLLATGGWRSKNLDLSPNNIVPKYEFVPK
jgi:hypothetical protein